MPDSMTDTALLSEEQVGQLKRELNSILWTDNTPDSAQPPEPGATTAQPKASASAINIQSSAHALIAAELFLRRGCAVATRCGAAFMIERSPDGRRERDLLKQMSEHWWLTLADHGVVDLSLHGTHEHPAIYCNRSLSGNWLVQFGEMQKKLDAFIQAKEQGCFYFTFRKKHATQAELANEMMRGFVPAQKRGIPLHYRKIVEHCEKVLAGAVESLSVLPQMEAWERLAPTATAEKQV